MGFWIEMRCDLLKSSKCLSSKNNGPMGHALNDTLGRVSKVLNTEARNEGWHLHKGLWYCPMCWAERHNG